MLHKYNSTSTVKHKMNCSQNSFPPSLLMSMLFSNRLMMDDDVALTSYGCVKMIGLQGKYLCSNGIIVTMLVIFNTLNKV